MGTHTDRCVSSAAGPTRTVFVLCKKNCLTHVRRKDTNVKTAGMNFYCHSHARNFNPHLHIIATDGCFYGNGAFMVCPPPSTGELEELFRYEVFKMLKSEGKINDAVIENMVNWPPARRALEPTPRRAPQRIWRLLRQRHLAA